MEVTHTLRLASATLIAAIALTGCGGNRSATGTGSPAASNTLTIVPSLGLVQNTDFRVRCLANGTVLAQGNTGTAGSTTVTLASTCSGPVEIEMKPGTTSVYYDEGTGATAPIDTATIMRALIPSLAAGANSVAVTALTEIAASAALHAAGNVESALTPAQISAANAAVVTQVLGASTPSFDILTPPSRWDASRAAGSLGIANPGDRYAYYLASLARLGGTSGTPALNVMKALAADLADGSLDGTSSGNFTYTSTTLASNLQTAITGLATFADPSLGSALGVSTGGTGGGSGGGGNNGGGGTGGSGGGSAVSTASGDLSSGLKVRTNPAGLFDSYGSPITHLITDGSTAYALAEQVQIGNGPVGDTAYDMVSSTTDGISWSTPTRVDGIAGYAVAAANGMLVAAGCNMTASGNTFVTTLSLKSSADGLHWTDRIAPTIADNTPYCINGGPSVYTVNNHFVAVGQKCGILTSNDGINWTAQVLSANGTGTNGQYACGTAFSYGGKLVIQHGVPLTGGSFNYSITTDGSTFTPHSVTIPTSQVFVSNMAFLPTGEVRVYTAPNYSAQTNPITVMKTTDLDTWTATSDTLTQATRPTYFTYFGASALQTPPITFSSGQVYACDRSANSGSPNYLPRQTVLASSDGINFASAGIFGGTGALAGKSTNCGPMVYLNHANRLIVAGASSTSTAQPLSFTPFLLSND